jgi:hypothetical protein
MGSEGRIRFLKSGMRDCSWSWSRVVYLTSWAMLRTIVFVALCFDPLSPTLSLATSRLQQQLLHLQLIVTCGMAYFYPRFSHGCCSICTAIIHVDNRSSMFEIIIAFTIMFNIQELLTNYCLVIQHLDHLHYTPLKMCPDGPKLCLLFFYIFKR